VVVASAGPYASLHCAPDRRQHPNTLFFTGQMPFLPPNQQCQSTAGDDSHDDSRLFYVIKWPIKLCLLLSCGWPLFVIMCLFMFVSMHITFNYFCCKTLLLYLLTVVDFRNSFTVRLGSEFVMKSLLKILLHLSVTALPCEIFFGSFLTTTYQWPCFYASVNGFCVHHEKALRYFAVIILKILSFLFLF